MAITVAGSWQGGGTGTTTLAVSPVTIGDVIVLLCANENSTGAPPTGASGGGVTTWHYVSNTGNQNASSSTACVMLWGVVTATGSATITVSGQAAGWASDTVRLMAVEFAQEIGRAHV